MAVQYSTSMRTFYRLYCTALILHEYQYQWIKDITVTSIYSTKVQHIYAYVL